MNVSLRPLEDRDLDTIYQQVTDPESVRMAAFTAEDRPIAARFATARAARMRSAQTQHFRNGAYPRCVTAPRAGDLWRHSGTLAQVEGGTRSRHSSRSSDTLAAAPRKMWG
jgi:hypothetical protein